MNTTLTLLAISTTLLLAAPARPAEIISTIDLSVTNTWRYQAAVHYDRSLGERSLLPPGLKEKMKLTNTQRADLKPIEDDFANTCEQYQTDNQTRIDDAQDAIRRARTWKDPGQLRAARQRLQDIWVGLHRDREAAVYQMNRLLSLEQLEILANAQNPWHENHRDEVNDPSAN